MKRTFLLGFLVVSLYGMISGQNWTIEYTPLYRKNMHVQTLSLQEISVLGGWPQNDSITFMAYSGDNGETWNFEDIFPGKMLNDGLYYNSGKVYAAGLNGVWYESDDFGETWGSASPGIDMSQKNLNGFAMGLWGTAFGCGGFEGGDGFIITTSDYGNSWEFLETGMNYGLNDISIAENSNNKLIICGENGTLLYSSNGGDNWTDVCPESIASSARLNAVHFFDGNHGLCVGGQPGTDSTQIILKTSDGGQSWTLIKDIVAPALNDVDMISENLVYAVGDDGIVLFTDDGGETWENVTIPDNPGFDLYSVDFVNVHFGRISGDFGVLMNYDDDETVAPQAITLEALNVTNHSAVLKANINAGFQESEVSFQYGQDESMGQSHDMGTYSGGSLENISYHISGLQENTHYYYRVYLMNDYGNYYGDTKVFYTGNPIPNWDFELWTEDISTVPDNWFVSSKACSMAIYGEDTVIQLVNPGNEFDDDQAVVMNAIIEGEGIPDTFHFPVEFVSGGTPFTDRPDSLYVKMKYDIEPQDSALIFLGLINGNEYVSENFFFLEGAEPEFVHKAFELDYLNANTPDRVAMAIVNTNPFDTTVFNNMMEISDIYFSGNTTDIPNHDFSAWTDYSYFFPDSWFFEYNYSDSLPYQEVPFERTEDAAHHEYAIKLQNKILEQDTICARISLKHWDQGIPIDKRFSSFSGSIKYFPEAQDTAMFSVIMYQGGDQVGWAHFQNHETVTNWTEFTAEIQYNDPDIVPDSMNLFIETSQWPATGESVLYVDKLSLDGDYIPVQQFSKEEINIFPNPAHNTLYFSEPVNNIEIYNVIGKKVLSKKGQHSSINISTLKPGMYFFRADMDILVKFVKK